MVIDENKKQAITSKLLESVLEPSGHEDGQLESLERDVSILREFVIRIAIEMPSEALQRVFDGDSDGSNDDDIDYTEDENYELDW